jgi:DNA replication and repair protein RecF
MATGLGHGAEPAMLIQQLHLQAFRRCVDTRIALQPGFNVLLGDNGSGKTTVLEALHLLAHGRSFRGRVRDGLIQTGQPALQTYVEWCLPDAVPHRAGLRHSGGQWEARLDGQPVRQISQLCEALAVISFEPGSHALVDGASEERRRYLDWGLFHVEHSFLPQWRRYSRALKQRNVLLRQAASTGQLEAWEQELAQAGELLTQYREQYVEQLQQSLSKLLPRLLPAAGGIALRLAPGWKRQEMALADALLVNRERDQQLGYTTAGPQRADLRLELRDLPGRECLSRGQAKQLALALLLAQAEHLAQTLGHWPVLQLDDLASELDPQHQQRLLEVLAGSGAQVLVTGTQTPTGLLALQGAGVPVSMFHVEHGAVRPTPSHTAS